MKSRLLLARVASGKDGAADRAAAMSVLERRSLPRRTAANCGCWRRGPEFDLENFAEARKRFPRAGGRRQGKTPRRCGWRQRCRPFTPRTGQRRTANSARRWRLIVATGGRALLPGPHFWKPEAMGRGRRATRRCRRASATESQLRVANALAQDKQMLQAVAPACVEAWQRAGAFESGAN